MAIYEPINICVLTIIDVFVSGGAKDLQNARDPSCYWRYKGPILLILIAIVF